MVYSAMCDLSHCSYFQTFYFVDQTKTGMNLSTNSGKYFRGYNKPKMFIYYDNVIVSSAREIRGVIRSGIGESQAKPIRGQLARI